MTSAGKVAQQIMEEPNASMPEALLAVLSCAGTVGCLLKFSWSYLPLLLLASGY